MNKSLKNNKEIKANFESTAEMEKHLAHLLKEIKSNSAGELVNILLQRKKNPLIAERAWEELCSRAKNEKGIPKKLLMKLNASELLEIISRRKEMPHLTKPAWEILYNRFKTLCLKTDYAVVGAGAAEDLVHDKFCKFLGEPLNFRNRTMSHNEGEAAGKAYILKIDRHMAYKHFKNNKDMDSAKDDVDGDAVGIASYRNEIDERRNNPESRLHREKIQSKMKCFFREFSNLQPVQQMALQGIAHNIAYEDLAKILGISEGSLRGHIYRARQTLRERCGQTY